jgi:ribosomal protein L30/L7E
LSNDIRITLIRSLNTPEIRGMVEKVKFLLHVEEAGESS